MPSPVSTFFTGLYPQWGGSFDEMHDFIERMRKMGVESSIVAELESRYC